MNKKTGLAGGLPFAAVLLFGGFATAAAAAAQDRFDDRAPAVYGEIGFAVFDDDEANSAAVGVMLPWTLGGPLTQAPHSLYWDLFVSNWSAWRDGGGGRENYMVMGVILNWRYQFGGGASPWFVEAGLGVSMLDHLYDSPTRSFSTRLQFTEVLGFGRRFGQGGRHELALRVQHFSNADIERPNPGLDFLRLRYAYRF